MSRALRTSSLLQPSTSRSEMTARWFAGSCSIEAALTSRGPAAPMLGVVVGQEPLGLDRGLRDAGGVLQGREGDGAALTLRAGLRGVDEDPEHPGLEGRPTLEPVERPEHAEPRL